jgi:hypothetical protein
LYVGAGRVAAGRLGGGANDVIAKRTRSHVQIAFNTGGTLPLFREKDTPYVKKRASRVKEGK